MAPQVLTKERLAYDLNLLLVVVLEGMGLLVQETSSLQMIAQEELLNLHPYIKVEIFSGRFLEAEQ